MYRIYSIAVILVLILSLGISTWFLANKVRYLETKNLELIREIQIKNNASDLEKIETKNNEKLHKDLKNINEIKNLLKYFNNY